MLLCRCGVVSRDTGRLFHETLLGVEYLHSRNWIHADLKPENVGIHMNPLRAVLLDFGCATKCHGGLAPTPGVGGTTGYLSPERYIDMWGLPSDIWALGVIGMQLSFGSHPWSFSEHPFQPDRPDLEAQRAGFLERHERAQQKLMAAVAGPPDRLDCTCWN